MKFAKDTRVRKEWGSQDILMIKDDYVPCPSETSTAMSSESSGNIDGHSPTSTKNLVA